MTNVRSSLEVPLRRGLLPEMAELSLLLPSWQMQKLTDLAQTQGVSVGECLRSMISRVLPMSPGASAN